jgi:hypothetical protein
MLLFGSSEKCIARKYNGIENDIRNCARTGGLLRG